MALLETPRPQGIRSLRDRAAALAHSLNVAVAGWSERRDLRARLSRLSAHELADIGLDRGDLDRMVGR